MTGIPVFRCVECRGCRSEGGVMQSFAARMSTTAMALLITLVSLTLACAAGPSVAADNVVLIVVDGLRPDALKQAKVPTIDGFIKHGSSTMKAQTVMPSLTLP